MPKWVVAHKGPNKGRLGYCVSVYDEGLSSRAVRWGTGHFVPGKRNGSRMSADSLRDATAEELAAHFAAHPDDEWQCVDQDDTKDLPRANTTTQVKNAAGKWVEWKVKTSLRHRGFVEIIDPDDKVVELHPTHDEATAALKKILGIDENWEDGDIMPGDPDYDDS